MAHQLIRQLCKHPAGGAQAEWHHCECICLAQPREAQVIPGRLMHVYMVVGLFQIHRENIIFRREVEGSQLDALILELQAFLLDEVIGIDQV